jgi:hypothetical protein
MAARHEATSPLGLWLFSFLEPTMPRVRTKTPPQPLVLPVAPPRNPLVPALAQRRASNAAGKHTKSSSAKRQAQDQALRRELP